MGTRYTTVNLAGTPDPNESTASNIIGLVTQPEARLTSGALVAAILDAASINCMVVLTPDKVTVFDEEEASDPWVNIVTDALGVAGVVSDRFSAVASANKAKTIELEFVTINAAAAVTGASNIANMVGVVAPTVTPYTLSSLVQKIEQILTDSENQDYMIAISQLQEAVVVVDFDPTATSANATVTAAVGTHGLTKVYEFDAPQTTQFPVAAGGGAQGWE